MLRQEHPRAIACHRDAKEVVKVAKTRHGKLGVKVCRDELWQLTGRHHENDVVNVEEQVCDAISVFVDKQRCVGLGRGEAHAVDVRGEAWVPGPGCQLEPVQGLSQEINIVRFGSVDEAGWLTLLEVAVEEGVLHVQLTDEPGTQGGDAEDNADHHQFDNRTKRLIVVDTGLL